MNKNSQTILIILFIILFHICYQQYLSDCEFHKNSHKKWIYSKCTDIFLQLQQKFGDSTLVDINSVSGVTWASSDIIKNIEQITLLDQKDNNIIVTLILHLFNGYDHVEISEAAMKHKLWQITNLALVNYNPFTKKALIQSNNWDNMLSLCFLLNKISKSELMLKNIQLDNLVELYEQKAKNDPEFFYDYLNT